jgi:hypothetical protein
MDKELPKFLEISIDLNNANLQNEKIELSLDMEISNYEELSNNIINEALAIKSISNILSKLILISASKFYTNDNLLKFDKFKFLYRKFLEKNVGNFLKSFINNSKGNNNINNIINNSNNAYGNFDNKLINDLNMILQSKNSKNDYEQNPNINPNIINIKTYSKIFDLSEDNYFIGLLDSLGPLNYNIFHWIDLKEMYILMKIKNYNMEIFFEFFDRLMLYNFYLSQADCQINTIISISYFINLIFSICKSENINSTYLFNGNSAINLSNFSEKNLAADIMQKEKNNYKKVNFEVFKFIYNNDIDDFLNFATKNFIDLFSEDNKNFQSQNLNPQLLQTQIQIQEGNIFTQFFSYKYNSLFFVLEYLKSFYQIKISGENLSLLNNRNFNLAEKKFIENLKFHYIGIQHILLNNVLVNLVNEINFYLKSEKTSEIEKCIFSLINLIYGIFSFLVNTNFEIENTKQLEILNYCMKNLWGIYGSNYISNYNNNIILITCAYMNLTNLSYDFFKKNNLIENLIPLLECNTNGKKEYHIFKIIMQKLKSDISPSNFLIILKFLISLIKSYDLFAIDILITEKIFLNFIINNPLGNTLNITEYEDNERGIGHILYCTIWEFLKNILITISDFEEDSYDSMYFSILEYLKLHEERIYKVLKNTHYKDNVGNILKKSLGYLEELENVTNVLNLLFLKSEKWRNNYPDFYLKILLLILEDAFRLFSPNVKISNHFICHSNFEYKMNEVDISIYKSFYIIF